MARPGLFAITESQCTEDEHDDEDDSKFRNLGSKSESTRGGLKDSTSFWIPTAAGTSAWVANPQDRGIDPRTGLLHVATTCTETSMRSKAPGSPSQLPESGDAFSCSRATATATCSEPTGLLLVGSKPSQPLPGT